jgi:ABC-type ATPase involved in cell division
MEEVIRLDNVVKMNEDGRRVIGGISFSIKERECVTIRDAAGSGKTALMRLIAGLDKPSAGHIHVLGRPVHEMKTDVAAAFRNNNIGILPRDPAFLDNLTLYYNLAMTLVILGQTPAKWRGRVQEQLKELGLLYAAHAHPPQLTPLERHKAAIARALVGNPKILLLDDFTADLSVADAEEIKAMMHAVVRYGAYTVVELTGADAGLICHDRTLTLDHGKLQEETQ